MDKPKSNHMLDNILGDGQVVQPKLVKVDTKRKSDNESKSPRRVVNRGGQRMINKALPFKMSQYNFNHRGPHTTKHQTTHGSS